jgi:protein-disulfide isomerase
MPTRKEKEALRLAKKRKQQVINYLAIGLAVVVVIVVIILIATQGQKSAVQPTVTATLGTPVAFNIIDPPAIPAEIQRSGATLGDPNAPVKIQEFADFQCPACSYFVQNLKPQIIEQYVATGKASFSFAPYTFLGPESFKAAEAAYCAADQNKFWEYYDYLYYNQSPVENGGTFNDTNLTALAEKAGLDLVAFSGCLSSGKYTQTVIDANSIPRSYGLDSTPSFLVNGKVVSKQTELISAIEAAVNP